MHVLTLQQPWATAVMRLGKDIENRSWRPPARIMGQRIAIHAGKRTSDEDVAAMREAGLVLPKALPSGVVLGSVIVAGWVYGQTFAHSDTLTRAQAKAAIESPWYQSADLIGWVLVSPRALAKPIPASGQQGLWRLPDKTLVL